GRTEPQGPRAILGPADGRPCDPLGNGVIGSTRHSGCRSWGSNPCSPVRNPSRFGPPPHGSLTGSPAALRGAGRGRAEALQCRQVRTRVGERGLPSGEVGAF